jgi:riboflavin synthase
MIPKGSIAIDGISLTINACEPRRITVSIIPHTAEKTTIGMKQNGDPVNLETDMIGKYVERFTQAGSVDSSKKTNASSGIDMEYLAKSGFL